MEEKSDQEKEAAERLLQEMIRYATTHRCRRQLLLSYFGEGTSHGKFKGAGKDGRENQCCDICAFEPPEERDVTIPFQKFLSCVIRTSQRFGATYVIDVLLGSKQKRIMDNGHQNLSTWGIGRELDRDSWYELSECLVEYGYLKKSFDYNVLTVTSLGREVLTQRQVVRLPVTFTLGEAQSGSGSKAGSAAGFSGDSDTSFADRTALSASLTKSTPVFGPAALQVDKKKAEAKKLRLAEDDEVGQRLYQRLKDLRRRMADDEDVPPYIIFGDVTLTALAVQKPKSHQELLEIYGIGTVKAERFGPSILRVINEVVG